MIDKGWFWFGNQGLSYIQLGRFWQILFFVALLSWSGLMFRALWPSRDTLVEATKQFWSGRIRLEHLIWAATINVAVLYIFGMIPLTGIEKSLHPHRLLALVGGPSVGRAIVRVLRRGDERLSADVARPRLAQARRALGLSRADPDLPRRRARHGPPPLLGRRPEHVGAAGIDVLVHRGAAARAADPRGDLAASADQGRSAAFDYGLAYLYILGSAFWNFVGAGVFGGGTLNAPLVNYYEHGTFLTLNHAHTSLFGAFGLLALGLIYFCLRYRAGPDAEFNETPGPDRLLVLQSRAGDVDFPPLLPDRLAAARRGLRAWVRLGAQPGVLRPDPVLAVDAHARRRRLLGRRAADGLGLHR